MKNQTGKIIESGMGTGLHRMYMSIYKEFILSYQNRCICIYLRIYCRYRVLPIMASSLNFLKSKALTMAPNMGPYLIPGSES